MGIEEVVVRADFSYRSAPLLVAFIDQSSSFVIPSSVLHSSSQPIRIHLCHCTLSTVVARAELFVLPINAFEGSSCTALYAPQTRVGPFPRSFSVQRSSFEWGNRASHCNSSSCLLPNESPAWRSMILHGENCLLLAHSDGN
jgi:hypothetical protein